MKQKMMQDLKGDAILARNGKLGSLKDVYFDDERWTVCYFVVDTGGWFSGREALISPHLVRAHEGRARELQVELTREELERAPGPAEHPPASRPNRCAGLPLPLLQRARRRTRKARFLRYSTSPTSYARGAARPIP